ncbi:cardiolipin synthase [Porphyromonadaceae bacterium NLAE-zl-C104]|nr:cardiolipin synthase [Porphyromonadaceae bacterium KH3R12]SFS79461.1 cardiolipin synthase [Porphyromonadaceae bacterium NLAE-zl-C104]
MTIQLNSALLLIIEILYLLTVVGIVVVVISENRNPIKTVAWILAVVFLPFIGIIWYAFFGQDATKKQVISRRMYSKLKKRPLDGMETAVEHIFPEEYINLINLLQNMDYTPLLGGNDVTLFTNGEDKFASLFADIEKAEKHIHIEYYVLLDDELGLKLQQALIRKAREGVEIRIIYDSFGSRKAKRKFFEDFRKAGIETEPFLKLSLSRLTSRLNYRTHRKIVVIDGRIGYVGGMNVADRYLKGLDWGCWRDTHARIEGKGVQGLQSVFLIDWYFVSQTLITSRDYFPVLENYGECPMQIVNSGPLSETNEISHGIMQAIYDARKSIFIQTPYFLPPDAMADALQAAAIKGVDVRVMMSKRSDVPLVQRASFSYIKDMLKAGVKVYMYHKGFLHSKMMVFDGSLTLVGSANFDSRSFEQNFEVEAFIYDKELGMQANDIFVEDQRFSEPVSMREWSKRPVLKRFVESFMRLFAPLL